MFSFIAVLICLNQEKDCHPESRFNEINLFGELCVGSRLWSGARQIFCGWRCQCCGVIRLQFRARSKWSAHLAALSIKISYGWQSRLYVSPSPFAALVLPSLQSNRLYNPLAFKISLLKHMDITSCVKHCFDRNIRERIWLETVW
jgi:hypothetical protein